MLVAFKGFHAIMANTYLENNDSLQGKKGMDVPDEISLKIKDKLSAYGMRLHTSEGEFYLDPDNDFLLKNFGTAVSPAFREFLTITASEQKEKFVEDGVILIPGDSLVRRIMVWEDFLEK